MQIEIVKDVHDDFFTYQIEREENKYFVSTGALKFSKPFNKFKDAVEFVDKHYVSFKKFLEDNNFKTNKQCYEEWEKMHHSSKQSEKNQAISEFIGEE